MGSTGPHTNHRFAPPLEDRISDSPRGWISPSRLIEWSFFILGCAIVLPWIAITNEMSFFLSRLTDSPYYSTFSSSVTSVYSVVSLLSMFYCTTTVKQSSPSRRIFVSLLTTIFFSTSLFFSTFVRGTPSAFVAYALVTAASLAAMSSYLCSAVYAQAALFGPSFLQRVFTGQGAIGVAMSIVLVVGAVVSLWGTPRLAITGTGSGDYEAENRAARVLFAVSALFFCVALAAYAWLTRQTDYKQVVVSAARPRDEPEAVDELTGLVSNRPSGLPTEANPRVYRVFKENWVFMFSIAYVYTVSFALLPAVTIRVRSVNPTFPSLLFTALHFLSFTVGDIAGRNGPLFPRRVTWTPRKILALSLLRTAFVPLVLLCNLDRPAATFSIIRSDVLFMLLLCALGYTNGYLMCVGLLVVSSRAHNPTLADGDVDVAATLASTFMLVGLASGTLSSFGVQAMV